MEENCSIKSNNKSFRYRAAGIIVEDDKILFATNDADKYYYSVGGAVHIGESSRECVVRELLEETGIKYTISHLSFILENFYMDENLCECHEISLFYIMKPSNKMPLEYISYTKGKLEKMVFIPIKDLRKYVLYPEFLKKYTLSEILSKEIKHVIKDERNE